MQTTNKQTLLAAALVCTLAFTSTSARAADPLPSWNDGKAKQSIIDFVTKVTKEGSPDFVPVPERISLPRTNVLLGCVHLLLFGAYLLLMFDR